MVDGLEKEFGDRMDFSQKDHSTPESEAEMKRFDIGKMHGMIILDSDGKKLWKEDGHEQKREVVEAEIEKVLEPSPSEETG